MAVTDKLYGNCFLNAFAAKFNLLSDTIKVTAHTATYTPDQDVHDFFNDITNELPTAAGYTVGGITAASKTSTYTGATNVYAFDFADPVWTASGALTIRTIVTSDTTPGTAATNPVIAYHQSSVDVTATDAAWTYQVGSAGEFTVTVA
jgi:hypothetical protein